MRESIVFIGSAGESRDIVDRIQAELIDFAKIERWDLSTFRPSQNTLDELVRQAKRCDFGIFVLGQDDETLSREKTEPSPRDNVVFEAGLFCGHVGVERTFYVVNSTGTKVPSDWAGLGYTTYDPDEPGRDAVAKACVKIRERMRELGAHDSDTPELRIAGKWWQFTTSSDEGAAIALFDLRLNAQTGSLRLIDGKAWSAEGRRIADFRSQAVSVDPNSVTLYYSWVGSHPKEENRPEFYGIGEIEFYDDGRRIDSGRGHFSSTSESDPTRTVRKSCVYRRAAEDDFQKMQSGSLDAREKLMQEKIVERRELTL